MHNLTSQRPSFPPLPSTWARRGFSQNSNQERMYPNPPDPASINSSQTRETSSATRGRNNQHQHRDQVGYNNEDENTSYGGAGGPSWPETFSIRQSSTPPPAFLQHHDMGKYIYIQEMYVHVKTICPIKIIKVMKNRSFSLIKLG